MSFILFNVLFSFVSFRILTHMVTNMFSPFLNRVHSHTHQLLLWMTHPVVGFVLCGVAIKCPLYAVSLSTIHPFSFLNIHLWYGYVFSPLTSKWCEHFNVSSNLSLCHKSSMCELIGCVSSSIVSMGFSILKYRLWLSPYIISLFS